MDHMILNLEFTYICLNNFIFRRQQVLLSAGTRFSTMIHFLPAVIVNVFLWQQIHGLCREYVVDVIVECTAHCVHCTYMCRHSESLSVASPRIPPEAQLQLHEQKFGGKCCRVGQNTLLTSHHGDTMPELHKRTNSRKYTTLKLQLNASLQKCYI